MCGICGYVSKKYMDNNILQKMNNSMVHRGPDDEGIYVSERENGYLGLAQRRLSIIDLSQAGHQPMFSSDNSVAIVFNGEIYNYREIKHRLRDKYNFISECDTEVIIAAYLAYGKDFLKHLNGMFAIALYDFRSEELIIARDRIGKKPLYYYDRDNVFIFGSELKPIMLHPEFEKNVKREIIARYMYQGYINAPDTIFENTHKLEPGMVLIYKNGHVKKERYWDLTERYFQLSKELIKDYGEAKNGLSKLLFESVNQRMIADVPLGTFLSGGIDSSLVTAIAQRNSSKAIKTFSIGFKEKHYDEAVYSKEIANYIGTEHTELYIDEGEMLELVESIPLYFDEPMADSSQIPTMLVSKLAREKVTVALSGDGGDELFCGYDRYDTVLKFQKIDKLAGLVNRLISFPIVRNIDILSNLSVGAQMAIENRSEGRKTQLGYDKFINQIYSLIKGNSNEVLYNIEENLSISNWQQRLMLIDLLTYLPGDILAKIDRASMKYSLESRCPLLDYKIIEYSFSLPHKFKYSNREKKYILKDILYDLIPFELLNRPKKGFSVPINKWIGTVLFKKLLQFSEKKKIEIQGIFNYDALQEIIKNIGASNSNNKSVLAYSKILWHFYVFQAWYSTYIENLWE